MLAEYLWGANWAEILTGVGTAAIATGIFVAAIQVRDARLERSRQVGKDILGQWDSGRMVVIRELVLSHSEAKFPDDATAAAQSLAEAVQKSVQLRTLQRYQYQEFVNFFEQTALAAIDDKTTYSVVQRLFRSQFEDTWDSWQFIIPYVWGSQTTFGENFGWLSRMLMRDRLRPERKEIRRYAMLTGGLGAWVRTVRLDRAAWGPSGIPYEELRSYLQLLSHRTSLAKDP